ncbi:MAG: hypothetical protein KME23_01985 [Goleter apudmare HA4340-LM2]|jgi:hypothetical protein|nr:hypothetical protein [Goleter apudmare HA4340-LM2]
MSTYSSSVSNRNSQAVLAKSYYQDDQQAKLTHLQAEVESLLQQLQSLKQQKLTASGVED